MGENQQAGLGPVLFLGRGRKTPLSVRPEDAAASGGNRRLEAQ